MNNTAQKICKICFILILVLTFILWCALLADTLQHDQTDDVLGSFLTVELSCIILLIAIVQEYIFYKSVRYFIASAELKTTGRTVFYVSAFLIDVAFIIIEAIYVLPYVL